jgi:hypothetical protein
METRKKQLEFLSERASTNDVYSTVNKIQCEYATKGGSKADVLSVIDLFPGSLQDEELRKGQKDLDDQDTQAKFEDARKRKVGGKLERPKPRRCVSGAKAELI